ncbi:hypothetical protein [Cereibacter sphaeroides]|uniref:hypothetical protein n=1 Tax=Cereibacter sphaeroides TaxID=1063 RepID=UPI001F194846|nr:hypothetical protein [Cereibacter sphaeroides]
MARRVELKRIGKRPLEMLARAGAFDALDRNRARVFEALDALVAYSAAIHEALNSSQVSLFGEAGADIPEPRLPVARRLAAGRATGAGASGDRLLSLGPSARRLHGGA